MLRRIFVPAAAALRFGPRLDQLNGPSRKRSMARALILLWEIGSKFANRTTGFIGERSGGRKSGRLRRSQRAGVVKKNIGERITMRLSESAVEKKGSGSGFDRCLNTKSEESTMSRGNAYRLDLAPIPWPTALIVATVVYMAMSWGPACMFPETFTWREAFVRGIRTCAPVASIALFLRLINPR